MYKRPCFDSSIFIGGYKKEICNLIKRGVVFDFLLEKARQQEFKILISSVAIAEVYRKKPDSPTTEGALDDFLELLNSDLLEVIEVDRDIAPEAHQLCRLHGGRIRPFDALHLASAAFDLARCDVLLTWDKGILGAGHSKIRVERPQVYDRDLFTESENATPEEQAAYYAANPTPNPSGRPVDIDLISTFSHGGGI